MDILVIDGNTLEDVALQLNNCRDCVKQSINSQHENFAANSKNVPSVSIVTFRYHNETIIILKLGFSFNFPGKKYKSM